MGLFDKIFNEGTNMVRNAANTAGASLGNKSETFTFNALPESVDQLKALPEASLDTPFKTAALTLCALCAWAASPEVGKEMLNFLKGPAPLMPGEISFINERFRDNSALLPFSYFEGAKPENNYTPDKPFRVTITSNSYSKRDDTHFTVWLKSGGADNPREVALRLKPSEGKWYLIDQHLLVGIRAAVADDPWA